MSLPLAPGSGRVPPHDLDAEGAVLGTILSDQNKFDEVADTLREEHFYADANRLVYRAMVGLREASQPLDIVLIRSYLEDRKLLGRVGGAPYLARLAQSVPYVARIRDVTEIVTEKWRLRQAIAICQTAVAQAYAGVEAPTAFLQQLEQNVADVAHQTTGLQPEAVRAIGSREITMLSDLRSRGESIAGVSTGLFDLDQKTNGLFNTDLTIVAARAGLGKTSFAVSLACGLARPKKKNGEIIPGHGVLFCSLEQPRQQLLHRIASHEAGINSQLWRKPRLDDDEWLKVSGSWAHLEHLPIWVDDQPLLTVLDLRAKFRRLRRDIEQGRSPVACCDFRIVFVDYIQLMKGIREKGDTREREIASLSQGLKNFAKEEDVIVIALAQVNRAVEKQKDKRPGLADLRESGGLEADADNVWFLYRESYYDRNATDQTSAELDLAKQRNGPTGTIDLHFDRATGRFRDRVAASYDSDAYEEFDA